MWRGLVGDVLTNRQVFWRSPVTVPGNEFRAFRLGGGGFSIFRSCLIKLLIGRGAQALVLLAWVAAFSPGVSFGEPNTQELRLQSIRQQVEEKTLLLRHEEAATQKLTSELDAEERNLLELERSRASLLAEYHQNKAKEKDLEEKLETTRQEVEALRQKTHVRLRAFYITRDSSRSNVLFDDNQVRHLLRNVYYFDRVRQHDQSLMRRLQAATNDFMTMRDSLQGLLRLQEAVREKIEEQGQALTSGIERRRQLLKEKSVRREALRRTVASLNREAQRLEELVASLSGGAPVSVPKPAEASVTFEGARWQRSAALYDGQGLRKGLSAPVRGRLLKSFGKSRATGFEEIIFNKGLEIGAVEGEDVESVAGGLVRFVGRMPGYGTMVLVDHGKRYYSLYGRLGEVLVTAGSIVEAGEVLAKTPAQDAQGRNFYFEIRKNGTPQNPLPFFGGRYPPKG